MDFKSFLIATIVLTFLRKARLAQFQQRSVLSASATLTSSPVPGVVRCPHRWLAPTGSSSCYRLWPAASKDWASARQTCKLYKADLLKLDSQQEKEWVIQEIMKYPVDNEWWIGLKRDPGNDTSWLWLDGSVRNDSTSVLQWGLDEPNNYRGEEDCAEIWDNLLNDKNCAQLLQFVCERPTNIPFLCDVDNGWDDHGLNNCYKFFDEKKTMRDARKICFEDDAELLRIEGDQDQEILSDFIRHENKASSWLKLSYTMVARKAGVAEYKWMWDLKSSAADTQTDKWWKDGTPDKDGVLVNKTTCSMMYTNTTDGYRNWMPSSCDDRHEFMCMKSLGRCPDGFRKNGKTCYRVDVSEKMRWNDARGYCNLRGTKILEINSEAKQDFMTSLLQSSTDNPVDVWIGLSRSNDQDWVWDSGTPLSFYEQDQLASLNSSGCVYIKSNGDGKWYIDDCSSNKAVLCSVPEDHPVITVPTDSKPQYICPDDFIGPTGDKCYKLVPDELDWFSARNTCMTWGADLAVFPTPESRNFLLNKIIKDVWIGLNDRSEEGNHVWLDSQEEAKNKSWKSYTQNVNVVVGGKYSENCVVMAYHPGTDKHGLWMDVPCNFRRSFVCSVKGEWNVALGKVVRMSPYLSVPPGPTKNRRGGLMTMTPGGINGCTGNVDRLLDLKCCRLPRPSPWVQLDLGTPYAIGKVVVYDTSLCTDCKETQLYITNSSDFVSNSSELVYNGSRSQPGPLVNTIVLPNVITGRYIQVVYNDSTVSLCEIQVFEATSDSSITQKKTLVPSENETDCEPGWTEDSSTGNCYFKSKRPLTWADAENVCTNMKGHLAVPTESSDESFLAGLFTAGPLGSFLFEFWLGASVSAGLTEWQTTMDSQYYRRKLSSELSRKNDASKTLCAQLYVDDTVPYGRPKSSSCLVRKQYVCQYPSSYLKFKTTGPSPEKSLTQQSSRVSIKDSSLVFQIRGSTGARMKLKDDSGSSIIVVLCSIKNKKSVIYEGVNQRKTAWLSGLCSDDEYRTFYISWKEKGIVVGKRSEVGENVFMSWSGHSISEQSPLQVFVSSDTTADVFWKFQRDLEPPKTESPEYEEVNLAYQRPTIQSSQGRRIWSTACSQMEISYPCCSDTNSTDSAPWWQLDLGHMYSIKEISFHGESLTGASVAVIGTDSTGERYEKSIYTLFHYEPLTVLSIPTKVRGRYIKVQAAGNTRKKSMAICDVRVIQDMDAMRCEDGWHFLDGVGMASCVFVSDMRLSWRNAMDYCSDHGATLGVPLSPEEQLFIFEQGLGKTFTPGDPSIWLGVHDMTQEGNFVTVDGTPLGYRDWGKGEPNNLNVENCVSMRLDYTSTAGQWNDSPCDREMRFYCKQNAFTTSTTSTTPLPTTTTTTEALTTTVLISTTPMVPTTTEDQTAGVCDKGWTYNLKTKACYRIFFDKNLEFYEAMKNCLGKNARLTDVKDTTEQDFLKDMLQNNPTLKAEADNWGTWGTLLIGGIEPETEGDWHWFLYDTPWTSGFEWSTNQPDDHNNNEDCLGVRTYHQYLGEGNDLPCTWKDAAGYICKQTSQELKCRQDWMYDVRTGTCYKEFSAKLTWADAKDACATNGAVLASIKDAKDQEYLSAIAISPSQLYWVGGSFTAGDHWVKWVDNTTWWLGTKRSFSGMSTDKDACVVFNKGQLRLFDCGLVLPFICKAKVPSAPTTGSTSSGNSSLSATSPSVTTTSRPSTVLSTASSKTSSTIAATSTEAVDELCGKGWDRNPATDICYQFVNYRASWDEASSICQEKAGNLVSIVTSAEQQYLIGRLHGLSSLSKDLWIGANNHDVSSGWRWSDGSPFAYFNWQPSSSNDATNGCGALTVTSSRYVGMWTASPCEKTNKKAFICKKVVNQRQVTVVTPVVPPTGQYYGCSGVGWVEYGDSCYLVVQKRGAWREAKAYCRKEGAELASIRDDNEQNFVFSQLPQDSYCVNIWRNDTQCKLWAERGECDLNPTWMAKHCHHACKMCLHNCRDVYQSSSKCTVWASMGECDKNHPWMLHNCAQSCGICEGAPTRGYWMGLQRKGYSRLYSWSDHALMTFTNWNAMEPRAFRKKGQSCGAMFLQSGKWNDGDCSTTLPGFVCKQQKRIVDVTTASPFKEGCSDKDSYGYGPYCYTYMGDSKPWDVAREYCTRTGGSLAAIKDIYVQSFVASELANLLQDHWIGLSVSNRTMAWTNDMNVPFTHFDKNYDGTTSNGTSCFAMRSFKPVGLWRLHDCAESLPFICQYPRVGFTTPTPPTTPSSTMATTTLPPCRYPWVGFDNYCYWLAGDDDKKPFKEAEEHCTFYGASLTSVNSFAEHQFITSQRPDNEPYLIGLNDRANEGTFTWSDGSPFLYSDWGNGEPNDAMDYEDCSEIRWDGQWNDIPCYVWRRFVCKIPRGKVIENFGSTAKPVFEACDGDPDWKALGDKCYSLETLNYKNWFEAREDCRTKGGDLASLHSEAEQGSLTSLVSLADRVVWIGYNRLGWTGQYHWSDSSPVDFTKWDSTQPNDNQVGEKCAVTEGGSGFWHDYNCNDLHAYLCMKPKDGITAVQTTTPAIMIEGGCPEGFIGFGRRCYLIVQKDENSYTSWTIAKGYCLDMKSELVSIHSSLEQAFLTTQLYGIDNGGLWIGLNDRREQSRFDWVDNSRLVYTNWDDNEPSSTYYAVEGCVEMYPHTESAGRWNDVDCYSDRGYICVTSKDPNLPKKSESASDDDNCLVGYTKFGESCYKLNTLLASWADSQQTCAGDNSSLAVISDLFEQAYIEVLAGESYTDVWIGGKYDPDKGFRWVGSSAVGTFVPWSATFDFTGSSCVSSSGQVWNNKPCDTLLPSVCKMPSADASPTVVTTVNPANQKICRDDSWLLHNGNCYTVVTEPATFETALDVCRSKGMMLTSIHSTAENTALSLYIVHMFTPPQIPSGVWIGMTGLVFPDGSRDILLWVDESPSTYVNFADYATFDAYTSSVVCVILYPMTSEWMKVECDQTNMFVCKGPADSDPAKLTTSTVPLTTTSPKPTTPSLTMSSVASASARQPSTSSGQNKYIGPPIHHAVVQSPFGEEDEGLAGGEIAGIVIGVLVGLFLIGVVIYTVYMLNLKKTVYGLDKGSLGFDNALFSKTDESVSIDG